jgi:hypothetical protein
MGPWSRDGTRQEHRAGAFAVNRRVAISNENIRNWTYDSSAETTVATITIARCILPRRALLN